jgi:hypothetical protein
MALIKMQASDAVAVASLIHLTDPKEPRLDTVHLDTLREETIAYGTDRFILGRYVATATADIETRWQLSANACKFITANVKPLNKWHTPEDVVFTLDTEARTVTIATNGATFTDNWPVFTRSTSEALERVVSEWKAIEEPQPVMMATRLLSKLSKLMDGFKKCDAWLLELGATATNSAKCGPVRATLGKFTVLLQPKVIKN